MKIIIEEPVDSGDEVIIRCREMTDEVLRMIAMLKGNTHKLVAYQGEEIYSLSPNEVYYIESVENKVFLYGETKVYETKQRLYELEDQLSGTSFQRVSKSVLLNLKVVSFLSPAFNGRLESTLLNGEKIIITRSYVGELKKKFHL